MAKSRVAELARAEAEDAERGEPEAPEVAPEGEPEDEDGADDGDTVPSAPPPTEASAEDTMRQLARIMDDAAAALADLFGLDEPLEPAPIDGILGFVAPGAFVHRPHEKYKACPTCNGLGDVLTGSHKQGNETQPCPRCAGRGYLEKLSQVTATATPGYVQSTATASPATASVGMVHFQPEPEPAAQNGDDGYGVPSWAGDPSIRPGA